MSDRSSELENYNELKFSREQSFFDKSSAIRWFIGISFVIVLFAILHFREEKIEVLELGSIAPGYIVAQIDFDFFDEEATIILKQEAIKDIGKIYQISEKEVRQRRIEFENFLIYNQEWRNNPQLSNSSFEDLYSTISSFEKALLKARFTDTRTLQIMKEMGILTPNYFIYTPNELTNNNLLPSKIWEDIGVNLKKEKNVSSPAVEFVISYFKDKGWEFHDDIPAQKNLRKKISFSSL